MGFIARPSSPVNALIRPRFQHDCTTCRFLGTLHNSSKENWEYDMYVCKKPNEAMEVVLRFGNSGEEYKYIQLEDVRYLVDGSPYKLAVKLFRMWEKNPLPARRYRVVHV